MSDKYAVIGNPIEHSKSPLIHAAFADQTGQDIEYGRILGDVDGFEDDVRYFFARNGRGLNVTVPFKERARDMADELILRALSAGAVNTLVTLSGGRLHGDNTDGAGLVRDLRDNHGVPLRGRGILLLGAGGASRGVLRPLLEERPGRLLIANRTAAKALALAVGAQALGPVQGCGLNDLQRERFDIIINATAAGLEGEVPSIPDACLTTGGVTYDMVYSDRPTAFVLWGREQGAGLALDGLGMLVEQAAESFHLWRGLRPETASVIRRLSPVRSRRP